jgi:hypothetical protein
LTQTNPQIDTLGNLLQIEQEVRQAQSENAVEFIAVNDTWRILHYRQATLWRTEQGGNPSVKLVSGLADLPNDSPFRQWLNQAIRHVSVGMIAGKAQLITLNDMPEALQDGWHEWMPEVVVVVMLPTPDGKVVGGLWLATEFEANEGGIALIERLSWVYGQALWAWRPYAPPWIKWLATIKQKKHIKRYGIAIAVIALFPMRLTALAPAEIIGKDAKQIGAPMDGVVAKFFVNPNQPVKAGDLIFSLDDTSVRNRNEVAGKSQAVAQADFMRETQKSFSDGNSKGELSSFKAKFEEKVAEAQYTRDLFERIRVTAPDDGIVVFSDPNDWVGKPVQTGERIVQLANPQHVQIAINLPVDDALNLEPGAKVKLYLNVSPLDTVTGTLTQASYEPAPVAEGFVAYRLKADIAADEMPPRIGLKGTAKIYGSWAPFIYHVLRKPLSATRRYLGV